MSSTFDFNQFKNDGEKFFLDLIAELETLGVQIRSLSADHLCFRVGTQAEYDFFKKALSPYGELLTEALVNGRPISTFKLYKPFKTADYEIKTLELPAPKTGTSYASGFEHAEFVIREDFDTFANRYPNLQFAKAGNPILNPELCLKLKNQRQVKFHHQTLERVIELEQACVQDIIFDFDGTLIQSRENIYETNRIVFSKATGREVSLQEAIDKYHPEFSKLFDAFAVTCSVKRSEALDSWGQVSGQFVYGLFDGALDFLLGLHGKGFRLHLWTARDEYSTRKILKHHGIEDLFMTLSFATAENSKPHASSLRFDWQKNTGHQVIMIGDSSTDMMGGQNISAIRAAALWDPYACHKTLIASGADLFFHRLEDLGHWLHERKAF